MGWALDVRAPIPLITSFLNLGIVAALALVVYADSLRRKRLLSMVRDWVPLPLMLLAYREMGWFAPSHHTYALEKTWIVWDRVLLHDWGLKALIELSGSMLPSILEVSYSLVYAIGPFCMAMYYVAGRRERMDNFLYLFLLGTLLSYAQFPFWPSEPPRTVFPGEDFPSLNTVFRQFNQALLGGYGIHTSVFPSAHVSAAFAAAFGMMCFLPERRWVGRLLLLLAISIATATVYGRYHYAVDAAAGFGVSLIAVGLSRVAERRKKAVISRKQRADDADHFDDGDDAREHGSSHDEV